jgi:hypothetical protein
MSTVDALVKTRGFIKARLTRLNTYFTSAKTKPAREVLGQIKTRLRTFTPSFEEFDKVQSEIESLDASSAQCTEREVFEDQYFQLVSDIEHFIDQNKTPSLQQQSSNVQIAGTSNVSGTNESNSNSTLQIKLPSIELPKFNGSYSDWLAFYEAFQGLINENNNLTDTQKFYYLQSCLTGEAKHVIEALSISSDNYQVAWELLKERYENKRLIGQTHIQAIFNLPAITKASATSLRQFSDSIGVHLKALKALQRATDQWDDLLIYLITTKFDFITKRDWEATLNPQTWPTMAQMNTFLKNRCHFLESMDFGKTDTRNQKVTKTSMQISATSNQNCFLCQKSHRLFQCNDFLKLAIPERLNKVKELKLCTNCFASNHRVSDCKGRVCKYCQKKHNTLLHLNKPEIVANVESHQNVEQPGTSASSNNCRAQSFSCHVLLPTALVKVYDLDGNVHQIRALLDSASQINLITENLCKKLKLKRSMANFSITGVGQTVTNVTNAAQIKIFSNHSQYSSVLSCFILQKITENVHIPRSHLVNVKIPPTCNLADPEFYNDNQIQLLIGCQLFWELLCPEQIKLGRNQPILQNTQLGWVISGIVPSIGQPTSQNCNFTRSLEDQVARILEVDTVDHTHKPLTADEITSEKHFVKTHSRAADGRFIVRLPFRCETDHLGPSKETAIKRFESVEHKFNKQPKFREQYTKFMTEYLQLGHMEPVRSNFPDNPKHVFYLPHHAVITGGPNTQKIRVVFDGSSKSANGISLNEILLKGPTIQQDLFEIITRFRTHKIAITADIVKMYRQILVHPDDRDLQRIVWRSNSDEPIQTYQLKTVTYETTSAPFLAVRSLHQLALDEKEHFPIAHRIVLNDFYVDDVLTGANSETEATKLQDQLIKMLKRGGFKLDKWASNKRHLIPRNYDSNAILNLDKENVSKTLGIHWNSTLDIITYSTKFNTVVLFTDKTGYFIGNSTII